jgi:hypothetical protein
MNDELLAAVDRELITWRGITREQGRFNSTAYKLGKREIGHIHRNGVADLAFPRAVYDELIATGRAQPHQAGVEGVVSYGVDQLADVDRVLALFRLNYDRATTAADRGATTDEENADLSETP